MSDVVHLEDRIYVLSTSSLMDDRRAVLKNGEMFAVFDRRGDVQPIGLREQGIFNNCTRHISRMEMFIGDMRPMLLSSAMRQDNSALAVDLTNPDIFIGDRKIRHGTI